MAMCKWFNCSVILYVVLFCKSALTGEITSVLGDVRSCISSDLEPCLVNHAVHLLLNVTNLEEDQTKDGKRSIEDVEEMLANKLGEALGLPVLTSEQARKSRAHPVLRTFNRAWKYLIPFLIGVLLKIAAFVPLVLTVLTIIAKSAFLSGHMAILLTGLNIALKFWYPKHGETHSTPTFHSLHHDDFSQHQQLTGHHQDSAQQSTLQGHNGLSLFGQYKPNRRYYYVHGRDFKN